VLLHDGGERRQRTLDATRDILKELGLRGYRFVTVSDLLREREGC
jgi:peptidoglycan/xylan/chitin deacetylase (PgdA/CDA1 family)